MTRRRLVPASGPLAVAADLEAQAQRLRKMAEGWLVTDTPPDVILNGTAAPILGLSYTDLVRDAADLEADAAKLRTLYA